MRAVLQRVRRASVAVAGETIGQISHGWLVLLGIAPTDTETEVNWLAEKILTLRAFADHLGKMNLSVQDVNGGLLVVSQFTLYADCLQGRRPSFLGAAKPEIALPNYQKFVSALRMSGLETQTGRFGAEMVIDLQNDGPVTLILDSADRAKPTNSGNRG